MIMNLHYLLVIVSLNIISYQIKLLMISNYYYQLLILLIVIIKHKLWETKPHMWSQMGAKWVQWSSPVLTWLDSLPNVSHPWPLPNLDQLIGSHLTVIQTVSAESGQMYVAKGMASALARSSNDTNPKVNALPRGKHARYVQSHPCDDQFCPESGAYRVG